MLDYKPYLRAPDYLPWLAYDDETKLFLLDGNYIGFTFSAQPLSGFHDKMELQFHSLMRMEFPGDTFLQFNLLVFDDVYQHIFNMKKARSGSADGLIGTATAQGIDFLHRAALDGNISGPIRSSKLLISAKFPIADIIPSQEEIEQATNLRSEVLQNLRVIGFRDLREVNDTMLVHDLSVIMNRSPKAAWRSGPVPVDETAFLREQALDYNNTITVNETHLRIGDQYATSLSAKRLPRRGYFGFAERFSIDPHTGSRGINCPHMISCTIKIEDIDKMKNMIERSRKYYQNYADGPFGRLLPEYRRRAKDLVMVSDAIATGDRVHKFALNFMLFNPTPEKARAMSTAATTYLDELGFNVMEDAGVSFQMLRANLPLGPEKEDVKNLSRYRTMNSSSASIFMPLFYEWRGSRTPLITLIGRGGQLMGFSPFDSGTNYNLTISGASGGGKSFLSNELITGMLATGGKVWVIDVGKSYAKLCDSLDGQYLSFEDNSNICLNPFSSIKDVSQFNEVQAILLNLLSTMAAPQEGLSDFQRSILNNILIELFHEHGSNLTIDLIADTCFRKAKEELGDGADKEFSEKRVSDIGFGLQAFCSNGQYGKYFTGPANIDFNKNLVLLELEELKNQPHLLTVVLLLLVYQVQHGMYLTSLGVKKMLLVDEAWDLLKDPKIEGFIGAGYRRFRKYNGSACIITQSIGDLHDSPTGRAILANSAAKIMFQQEPQEIDRLAAGETPAFERALGERLKTVHTIKGVYAEAYIQSREGAGIGRLIVDPFRKLLYSTDAEDVAAINRFVDQGMTTVEAINSILESRTRSTRVI